MKNYNRVEVALIMSMLPDVTGTEEGSGKGKAPKEGKDRIF